MSLKNMRALAVLCKNEGYTPETIAMGEAAMMEIEALKKAAMIVSENVRIPAIPAELEPALRLMERIAKEDK